MDDMGGGRESIAAIHKDLDSPIVSVAETTSIDVRFEGESVKVDAKNVGFRDFDCWVRQRFGITGSSKVRYLNAAGEGTQMFLLEFELR
jgi:hypothetical protein